MKPIALAAIVLVCATEVVAQRIDRSPEDQARIARHGSSEKSVLLKYDIATAAVTALTDMPSLDDVVDMNPSRALRGPYAVVVAGDGSSFIKPVPVNARESAIFVLIPFSVDWDVQSVAVYNLPGAGTAARSFTIDGDLLLSKTDIAAANARPSFKAHHVHARPEWCIEPTASSDNQFATSDGGHVCVTCISCADGSWEICGQFYRC
jgi:hypothetical protein